MFEFVPERPTREVKSQLWMTSGTAKGCKNYYEDRNGTKQYLPGFLIANSIALLTVVAELSQLETETKVVNVYWLEIRRKYRPR